MTVETIAALVAIVATTGQGLWLLFGLRGTVDAHTKALEAASGRLLAHDALLSDVKETSRTLEDIKGRVLAHDAIAVEGRGAHGRLEERVQHLSERIDEKASAESVESVAREVATMRSDNARAFDAIGKQLERIENKISERK